MREFCTSSNRFREQIGRAWQKNRRDLGMFASCPSVVFSVAFPVKGPKPPIAVLIDIIANPRFWRKACPADADCAKAAKAAPHAIRQNRLMAEIFPFPAKSGTLTTGFRKRTTPHPPLGCKP
jgi:hypothetical protein